ncbi:proton-conducting transporter membrane subunit [Desulfocurvus sp.]|uniref:NADH-quinone oxidoreductase subunit 5 family protein n=1 Tax=Desulfocurvus sp. TaxID=2871698 RepID=UPI0025BC4C96|nr:proton-conducting transporter membrane subunit [Desulfocurvus sp.]MCK9240626.1 NADH-quinone oxidoreductase subunit L [Desulfocurvus sp.]
MSTQIILLVLLPFAAGLACYLLRAAFLRSLVVLATAAILTAASVALLSAGPISYSPGPFLGLGWGLIVSVLDFALLGVILFYGFKHGNLLIKIFSVLQMLGLLILELFWVDHSAQVPAFHVDQLSAVMVLIISIVGSLICVFALPYMKEHEEHLHLEASRQPRFFLFLVLFLGAMNGLVMANNILWLYFFFESTTLCSFMLIGHDGTEIAVKNAVRALWMNSAGGLAFVLGMMFTYASVGSLDIQVILASGGAGAGLLVGMGLICLAGFTKAAQVPFQSWLLGAMVAPTPVSALLHSSTMVKAGVYVVLRMAPAYAGSFVSDGVALCGAFTFLACAALAIGQSNGKKILAYSTISNLGLIIACAGINTPAATAAAIFLIIFHAVSKALLFLCVGTIEQRIGSRDIEDMRGLYLRMPQTAWITITGILTMLLPPFGVLMAKWLAIESASGQLVVVTMMALASALTVVYWARWAGTLLAAPGGGRPAPEGLPALIRVPLLALVAGAVLLSVAAPQVYDAVVAPMLPAMPSPIEAFYLYPLFAVLGAGLLLALRAARRSRATAYSAPYMSGANIDMNPDGTWNGPMNQPVGAVAGNYYLPGLFGEERLTTFVNVAAAALIVLMIGGAL